MNKCISYHYAKENFLGYHGATQFNRLQSPELNIFIEKNALLYSSFNWGKDERDFLSFYQFQACSS